MSAQATVGTGRGEALEQVPGLDLVRHAGPELALGDDVAEPARVDAQGVGTAARRPPRCCRRRWSARRTTWPPRASGWSRRSGAATICSADSRLFVIVTATPTSTLGSTTAWHGSTQGDVGGAGRLRSRCGSDQRSGAADARPRGTRHSTTVPRGCRALIVERAAEGRGAGVHVAEPETRPPVVPARPTPSSDTTSTRLARRADTSIVRPTRRRRGG